MVLGMRKNKTKRTHTSPEWKKRKNKPRDIETSKQSIYDQGETWT